MKHFKQQTMDERTVAWLKAFALTVAFAGVLTAAGPAHAVEWTKPLDLVRDAIVAIFTHPIWHALFGALFLIAIIQYASSKNIAYIGGGIIVALAWIAWGAREEFFG